MRGKVHSVVAEHPGNEDHPRLCGEKYEKSPPVDSMKGSPPPMRGKVYKPLKIKIHCRITPAYAGKSHR